MRIALALISAAIFSFAPLSQAMSAEKVLREDMDALARIAHGYLPNAKIGNGELIGEERAKTLVYPLIPLELIELIIVRGHIAGFAKHCGLEWEKDYYLPLMGFMRKSHTDFNDYQFAYIGMLHGVSMSNAEQSQKDKPCDDTFKEKIRSQGPEGMKK